LERNSSADTAKTKLLAILLGRVGIVLVILFAFLFWTNLRPARAPGAEKPLNPPIPISTEDCGDPALLLGSNTFQMETIQHGVDGSLAVPSDTTGIAYWVKGTDPNFVFVLSPMPRNMTAMATLTIGSTAKVTWSNCNSTTYSLSAPQQASLQFMLPDQAENGITVFFETDVSGVGFMFKGKVVEK